MEGFAVIFGALTLLVGVIYFATKKKGPPENPGT